MKRPVLAIPLDEIQRHFEVNSRQDLKVVAPQIMTGQLFSLLRAHGRDVKAEQKFDDGNWQHSAPEEPNLLCESADFADAVLRDDAAASFALSFANPKAIQDSHYHKRHLEIYFSEHSIAADFRVAGGTRVESVDLPGGGAVVFGAGVIHKMRLGGLTMVLEIPAAVDDKFDEEL